MTQEWTTAALANWCTSLRDDQLPADVIEMAEDCILDAIGCAVAGMSADGAQHVKHVALNQYRDGPACIWFSDQTLHATGAAFANATSASILDIDDGHRRPLGHPGAAVIPTALAVGEEMGASGAEILRAIIIGYEVCVRIGTAEQRKAYHSGNWTSFGAAATASILRGLSAEQIMHALAVTTYHGPRLADLTLSKDMGSNVKESIPWSVVAGMSAVDLAREGFSGCRDALDIEERFIPDIMLDELGQNFEICGTYFKQYSACRWIHCAVEALLQIMIEQNLTPSDIQSVHVETFLQAAALNNLSDPPTPESAQYSVPYCLGLAATLGETALMPMKSDNLHHPDAVAFAEKITVVATDEMCAMFPQKAPSKVILESTQGKFEGTVEIAWGEPAAPTGRVDLIGKFHALTRDKIGPERAGAIVDAVYSLKIKGIQPLVSLIKPVENIKLADKEERSYG